MEELPRLVREALQPLHPAIRSTLDPQYVAYHEAHLQYLEPDEAKEWDGSVRMGNPSLPPGGTKPVPVGSIQDYTVGRFRVRAYTPTGERDQRGWPVLVWFHGGGWAVGGLNNGMDYLTRICQEARCLVVSVDYGLAPENPFPKAVEDSIDAVRWVASAPVELGGIDISRISIGGTSSGGNLATVAALAALNAETRLPSAQPSLPNNMAHPPVAVLLFIPVIDNTATVDDVWKPNGETAPWLTAARMEWYRKIYFTDDKHRKRWDASPNLAPTSLLQQFPRTWIAVAEMDLLAPEALAFGEQLRGLGVDVETVVVKGGTHSILSLHGRIDRGQRMIEDGIRHLQETFAR